MKLPVFTTKIENRILTVVTIVITCVAMWGVYKFGILPTHRAEMALLTKQIEIQNKLIAELAKDPKYSIQNDFGKMKPLDSSTININLDNTLIHKDTLRSDTVITKKKGFLKRLFNIK